MKPTDSSSKSNNPHKEMFMLRTNPRIVRNLPFFVFKLLINLRIKTGAIIIARLINGKILLCLVKRNIPKPSKNNINKEILLTFILFN